MDKIHDIAYNRDSTYRLERWPGKKKPQEGHAGYPKVNSLDPNFVHSKTTETEKVDDGFFAKLSKLWNKFFQKKQPEAVINLNQQQTTKNLSTEKAVDLKEIQNQAKAKLKMNVEHIPLKGVYKETEEIESIQKELRSLGDKETAGQLDVLQGRIREQARIQSKAKALDPLNIPKDFRANGTLSKAPPVAKEKQEPFWATRTNQEFMIVQELEREAVNTNQFKNTSDVKKFFLKIKRSNIDLHIFRSQHQDKEKELVRLIDQALQTNQETIKKLNLIMVRLEHEERKKKGLP